MTKFSAATAICLGFGLATAATALRAELLISEASGVWAASDEPQTHFLARLVHGADEADLLIWNTTGQTPDATHVPALTASNFAMIAFATDQRLEVLPSDAGAVLQVVSEFSDEESEGHEEVQLRYLNGQFVLTGYHTSVKLQEASPGSDPLECRIDFTSGKVVENGRESTLPTLTAEDLDPARWYVGKVLDREWCQF